MEDTMEAYRGAGEIPFTEVYEKVYITLDGDDDPIQELFLDDVVTINDYRISLM